MKKRKKTTLAVSAIATVDAVDDVFIFLSVNAGKGII